MKKQALSGGIAFLILLASCNMNGRKLYADGDSDNGADNDNKQQTKFELETNFHSFRSAQSTVLLIVSQNDTELTLLEKEFNAKMAESDNDEQLSAAYAAKRVEGASEEQALIYAKEEARTHREVPQCYQLIRIRHGENAARRFYEAYIEKRQQHHYTETKAVAYAQKLVLENKAHQEAETFAEELENSFTIMEGISTRAQPEDMKEQGETAELYRAALRANEPLTYAKTFADTFEAQVQAGKAGTWAHAYADMIANGKSEAYAIAVADAYEAQLKAGKSVEWAHAYAFMIADNESEAYATTYAGAYDAQRQAGKSDDWAHAYAFMIADNESEAFATSFADAYEAQRKAGKSHDWASAYASMIAKGQPEALATTYADTVEAQRKAGKSEDWAIAYADMIAKGKSAAFAKNLANLKHPGG